jgi:transcriptional regulator with XRE-family HTH domain
MSEFGDRLKRMREARGTSQSRMAERAGYDHSYASRVESGQRTPTREAVDRFAQALTASEAERDALLAAAGFRPVDPLALIAQEPEVSEIVRLLHDEAVPEEYRDNIRQVLRLLAEQVQFVAIGRNVA